MDRDKKNINKKFLPIKIIKDKIGNESRQAIQIKLATGHVVYLPVEIGMNEIAQLIHSLGLPHA